MKNIFRLLVILMPVAATAQQADSSQEKKSVFAASINYQSRLHFYGRTDSLKSSGFFPLISYTLKNGLYAQGTAVFIQNPSLPLQYTGASAELGYQFPETKHFEGKVYASRFIYQDNSVLVQSAVKGQTGLSLTWKNKVVNLNAGTDVMFSDHADVVVSAGLDHLFVMPIVGWNKAALAVMPSATLNAGTQQFTNTYIEKGNMLGVPVTRQRTEQVQQFNILSYEMSVPVVLVKGKFNAYLSPSLVVPRNLLDGEQGETLWYVAAGLGIRL